MSSFCCSRWGLLTALTSRPHYIRRRPLVIWRDFYNPQDFPWLCPFLAFQNIVDFKSTNIWLKTLYARLDLERQLNSEKRLVCQEYLRGWAKKVGPLQNTTPAKEHLCSIWRVWEWWNRMRQSQRLFWKSLYPFHTSSSRCWRTVFWAMRKSQPWRTK